MFRWRLIVIVWCKKPSYWRRQGCWRLVANLLWWSILSRTERGQRMDSTLRERIVLSERPLSIFGKRKFWGGLYSCDSWLWLYWNNLRRPDLHFRNHWKRNFVAVHNLHHYRWQHWVVLCCIRQLSFSSRIQFITLQWRWPRSLLQLRLGFRLLRRALKMKWNKYTNLTL